jgi:hypothetical protein
MSDIKTQIAGLKSLIDIAEREANKLTDYRVKSSSTKARNALKQLVQSTKQLRNDITGERKKFNVKVDGGVGPCKSEIYPSPGQTAYKIQFEEPIIEIQEEPQQIYARPVLERQPAYIEPPVEQKKRRGRPCKVVDLYN